MTDADFLIELLSDRRPHTLNEIIWWSFQQRGCGLTVHSRISDLRKRGFVIVCEHVPGAKRGEAYRYTMLSAPYSLAADGQLEARMTTRIERMEAVVEAARALTAHKFGNLPSRSFYMLREALTEYDTAEAIARGEISPDEAALVDEEDE